MLKAFENTYAKDDVKKENPVSLLGDTGVTEEDILQVIPKFQCWCEANPDANIIEYFTKRHMPVRVVKALAILGFQAVITELNQAAEEEKKEDK